MLNTFFFGYLQLKWKRLVRVLMIGVLLILPFVFLENMIGLNDLELLGVYSLVLVLTALSIGLISWVLKPFIVKD